MPYLQRSALVQYGEAGFLFGVFFGANLSFLINYLQHLISLMHMLCLCAHIFMSVYVQVPGLVGSPLRASLNGCSNLDNRFPDSSLSRNRQSDILLWPLEALEAVGL